MLFWLKYECQTISKQQWSLIFHAHALLKFQHCELDCFTNFMAKQTTTNCVLKHSLQTERLNHSGV